MCKTSTEVAHIVEQVFAKYKITPHHNPPKQKVWDEIFTEVFGSPPQSTSDPRWNTLFDSHTHGLGALHVAFELGLVS